MKLKSERWLFSWQIKNLILCARSINLFLETPIFVLKNTSTWRLELEKDTIGKTLLSLRRCDVAVPASIYAQFQCCFNNAMHKTWFTDKSGLFIYDAEHTVWGLNLTEELNKELQRFVEHLSLDDVNTLNIEIIFYYKDECYKSILQLRLSPLYQQRERFANRMGDLYRSGKYADVVVRVKNGTLNAHKAILSTRSSFFARLLANNPSRNTIELLDVDEILMRKLLLYMYTSRTNISMSDLVLPFGLYECAQRFGVANLEKLLKPQKLNFRTEIYSEQCIYKWRIANIGLFEKGADVPISRLLSRPVKCKPTSKEEFRFALCFYRTSHAEEDIGIFVEMLEGDCPLQVLFRVSLMDSENRLCYTQQAVGSLEKNKMFGFYSFLDRKHLTNKKLLLLPADVLSVCFNLKFSTANNILVSDCIPRVYHSPFTRPGIISQDFGKLFGQDSFTDVILIGNGTEFKAHRILLSAHSDVFENLLDEKERNNERSVIVVDDIILPFSPLLEYIYTGHVGTLTSDSAIRFYSLSIKYRLFSLQIICSSYLKNNFEISSACKVFLLARIYRDYELLEAAKSYICNNTKNIMEEELQNLIRYSIFDSLDPNRRENS